MGQIAARALTLVFIAGLTLVPGPRPAEARDVTIQMRDNHFATPFMVLTPGDTATFRNAGSVRHTVRTYPGSPSSFDSSPRTPPGGSCNPLLPTQTTDCMDPGATFSVEFTQVGTYDYFCSVHGDPQVKPDPDVASGQQQPCGMCGQILVRTQQEPPPPTRDPSPSPSPTQRATGSPTETPTDEPEPSPNGEEPPLTAPPERGGGGGGRALLGLGGILVLSGAGWLVWRKYLNA